MTLGWKNKRRKKRIREKNPNKIKGKNHVQDHHVDQDRMEWLIAAQDMKLIFVVWNWMRISVGSLKNTLKNWKKITLTWMVIPEEI